MVSLAEDQASLEELEDKEEKEEEEKGVYMIEIIEEVEEGPDEGELLVIRRPWVELLLMKTWNKEKVSSTLDAPWVAKCALSLLTEEVVLIGLQNHGGLAQDSGHTSSKSLHNSMAQSR